MTCRVWPTFASGGPPCPVCKTRAARPTVLVPMSWTESGLIVEERQVHEACWRVVAEMGEAERKEETSVC